MEHYIRPGTGIAPVKPQSLRKLINPIASTWYAPRELGVWLRNMRLVRVNAPNVTLWSVDACTSFLLRRFPVGVGNERVRRIFGDLPEAVELGGAMRRALDAKSLEELVPEELDQETMTCESWTRLGTHLLRLSPGLREDIKELTAFGVRSSPSMARVLLLNRMRRNDGLPAFKGFSLNKLETRIVPAIKQLAGFCSEVLDTTLHSLDDVMRGDGELVLSYAASCHVLRMGPTVIEERLDALSEILQFVAVRHGRADCAVLQFSRTVKDLGTQLAAVRPPQPRFANMELLGRVEPIYEHYNKLVDSLVKQDPASFRSNYDLCFVLRAATLIGFMTPFMGGQRAQTVVRIQANSGPCVTCGHTACPGNRIKVVHGPVPGEPGSKRLLVTLTHHKNELAGRTRAPINYSIKDPKFVELWIRYCKFAIPVLHGRPAVPEPLAPRYAAPAAVRVRGQAQAAAVAVAARPDDPRNYAFLTVRPKDARQDDDSGNRVLAGQCNLTCRHVTGATKVVMPVGEGIGCVRRSLVAACFNFFYFTTQVSPFSLSFPCCIRSSICTHMHAMHTNTFPALTPPPYNTQHTQTPSAP